MIANKQSGILQHIRPGSGCLGQMGGQTTREKRKKVEGIPATDCRMKPFMVVTFIRIHSGQFSRVKRGVDIQKILELFYSFELSNKKLVEVTAGKQDFELLTSIYRLLARTNFSTGSGSVVVMALQMTCQSTRVKQILTHLSCIGRLCRRTIRYRKHARGSESSRGWVVLMHALTFLGGRYERGAESSDAGSDCARN